MRTLSRALGGMGLIVLGTAPLGCGDDAASTDAASGSSASGGKSSGGTSSGGKSSGGMSSSDPKPSAGTASKDPPVTVTNPLTDPEDGPAAGNPDGQCPIPAEAGPADVSSPDNVIGDGSP